MPFVFCHGEKANWRIGELSPIGEKAGGTFVECEKPSIYAIFFTVYSPVESTVVLFHRLLAPLLVLVQYAFNVGESVVSQDSAYGHGPYVVVLWRVG